MPMCITGANNRLQTRVGVGYSAQQARFQSLRLRRAPTADARRLNASSKDFARLSRSF